MVLSQAYELFTKCSILVFSWKDNKPVGVHLKAMRLICSKTPVKSSRGLFVDSQYNISGTTLCFDDEASIDVLSLGSGDYITSNANSFGSIQIL